MITFDFFLSLVQLLGLRPLPGEYRIELTVPEDQLARRVGGADVTVKVDPSAKLAEGWMNWRVLAWYGAAPCGC